MTPLPREERILNLLSALLVARAPLPFAGICGAVAGYEDDASPDALEKRFDRDKAELRSLGVPIEYVADDGFGGAGYRIAKERFFLEQIEFTHAEGIVLAALTHGAAREGVAASLRSALLKLRVDSPLAEVIRESVGEQQQLDPRLLAPEETAAAALATALSTRCPVRFTYYSLHSGRQAERTVEPYGVGYCRGHWYLVGHDTGVGEERMFRLSRIRSGVETLEPTGYEIPADFELRSRIGVPPWELGQGDPIEARIRFEPDVAWMIEENVQSGQSFEPQEDEGGILAVRATDADALVRWVARYGPDAEILEPPELRERLVVHLEGLIARYER